LSAFYLGFKNVILCSKRKKNDLFYFNWQIANLMHDVFMHSDLEKDKKVIFT